MSDDTFFLLVAVMVFGAMLTLMGMAYSHYVKTSPLYEQERIEKAFREIVKREKKLGKQRARTERLRETVDGLQ